MIQIAEDLIHREVSGEAVILNTKTGVYCGLDEVGSRIWKLIQEPASVKSIVAQITDEYDVDPKVFKQDLMSLLDDLSKNGLIEIET